MRNNGEGNNNYSSVSNGLQLNDPWQFDILQAKEATFLSVNGCSKREIAFAKPGYPLKPSDRRKL